MCVREIEYRLKKCQRVRAKTYLGDEVKIDGISRRRLVKHKVGESIYADHLQMHACHVQDLIVMLRPFVRMVAPLGFP